jgi:hypothetical protein
MKRRVFQRLRYEPFGDEDAQLDGWFGRSLERRVGYDLAKFLSLPRVFAASVDKHFQRIEMSTALHGNRKNRI